ENVSRVYRGSRFDSESIGVVNKVRWLICELEMAETRARSEHALRVESDRLRSAGERDHNEARAAEAKPHPAVSELRRKLTAAYREIARRDRRDRELAAHLPQIAARLQSIAADAAFDLSGAEATPGGRWDKDPAIDWTGVDGGHP